MYRSSWRLALVALTAGIGRRVERARSHRDVRARRRHHRAVRGRDQLLIAYVVNAAAPCAEARQCRAHGAGRGHDVVHGFGFDIAYSSVARKACGSCSCFMAYLAFRYDFSPVRMFAIGQGVSPRFHGGLGGRLGWPVLRRFDGAHGSRHALAFISDRRAGVRVSEIDLKRVMAWSVDSERRARAGQGATVPAFASASAGDAELPPPSRWRAQPISATACPRASWRSRPVRPRKQRELDRGQPHHLQNTVRSTARICG
ncbi:MAG: hypothetical protein ACLSVD_02280 [Eggerthellaceae bacterium]